MHADEILFIEDGIVAERGSHEELITQGGKYQELYELQIRPDMDLDRSSEQLGRIHWGVAVMRGGGGGGGGGMGRMSMGRQSSVRPGQTAEQIFGDAFDGQVVKRFILFVMPYRKLIAVTIAAVLVFSGTTLAFPLLVKFAIDRGLQGAGDKELLGVVVAALFGAVVLNYISNFVQEIIVVRLSMRVLFNMRRAMYLHLQRISMSFMDKTEIGRLMARLQGDVSALQEFLETAVFAIGDLITLIGIICVLLILDPALGALTLIVIPVLFLVRMVWLPRAKRAFLRSRELASEVNGALNENVNGVKIVPGHGPGAHQLRHVQ